MDLPLDWNNLFNSDPRTEGVHVESIPDALVMSLTTLGKPDPDADYDDEYGDEIDIPDGEPEDEDYEE